MAYKEVLVTLSNFFFSIFSPIGSGMDERFHLEWPGGRTRIKKTTKGQNDPF